MKQTRSTERQRQIEQGMVTCPRCHETKRISEFYPSKREVGGVSSWCKSCDNENCREYAESGKRLVFDHYGRSCVCCGESEELFLTIDHVNNDGAEHRRAIGPDICAWLLKNDFPEGFQVLCYNCNCGKQRNGGTCPHQTEDES